MSYSERASDEIRDVLPEGQFTRRQVHDKVDLSYRHVANVLNGLAEEGELERRKIGQTWVYVKDKDTAE